MGMSELAFVSSCQRQASNQRTDLTGWSEYNQGTKHCVHNNDCGREFDLHTTALINTILPRVEARAFSILFLCWKSLQFKGYWQHNRTKIICRHECIRGSLQLSGYMDKQLIDSGIYLTLDLEWMTTNQWFLKSKLDAWCQGWNKQSQPCQ